MIVTFSQAYLQDLFEKGTTSDKKHRFQPQIVKKYSKVINIMKAENDVLGLTKYGALHYEHLQGDKEGISSVRVNAQYRIEFTEQRQGDSLIANICNIIELSNHYQ